jgi:hypothetical protein
MCGPSMSSTRTRDSRLDGIKRRISGRRNSVGIPRRQYFEGEQWICLGGPSLPIPPEM